MVSTVDISTDNSEYQLPDADRLPHHVAMIMDGNGRWARQRGLPRLAGHKAGTENLREILSACVEFGIRVLTIYAFSTENWNRPEAEVKGLLAIMRDVIDRELAELDEQGVRICHIGDLTQLSPALRKRVEHALETTKSNDTLILNVAFNYGGRAEIVHAIRQIVEAGHSPDEISEDMVNSYLYTSDVPDPDLVIRTSGELRLSNFLIWQSAYAEYYFADVFWPDFGKEELLRALIHYSERERRFGKVLDSNES